MTTLREVAQQALEYLDAPSAKLWPAGTQHRIITALRAALAEPVQEPVAWLFTNLQSGDYDFCYQEDEHDHDREMWHKQPLYTAPPQRKPLTEEEIQECFYAARNAKLGSVVVEIARAIERAHGIGGQDEP